MNLYIENLKQIKIWYTSRNKQICRWYISRTTCIQYRGKIVMNQQKVADIMTDRYYSVSSNNNYSPHFLAIKHREENKPLNFYTNE